MTGSVCLLVSKILYRNMVLVVFDSVLVAPLNETLTAKLKSLNCNKQCSINVNVVEDFERVDDIVGPPSLV